MLLIKERIALRESNFFSLNTAPLANELNTDNATDISYATIMAWPCHEETCMHIKVNGYIFRGNGSTIFIFASILMRLKL